MKILFLESYFKPEITSGAHLAEDMRQALAEAGHTLQIYAPTPSRGVSDEVRAAYKQRKRETEQNGAIHIHRFSLYREGRHPLGRAIRYAVLELKLLWFGLREKGVDLLPVGSTPPINGLMAVLIKKIRKTPYVYIVQDLFPDSLVSTGLASKGSLLWKIGSWVSGITYRHAAHIIAISEDIRSTLLRRGVPAEKISVIYNWINTDTTHHIDRDNNTLFDELHLSRDAFYITYAGNIGRSQPVELVVDCAEKLKEYNDIRFVIFGDGSEKYKLAKRIEAGNLDNIHIFPMQPMERVSEVYSLGDASFVICKRGVGGGAFPSKAASIMATGTPVIASFDAESDLCRLVESERAGVCARPEDAGEAVKAILKLYTDRADCRQYGENARRVACTVFSKETGLRKRLQVYETAAKNPDRR